MGKILAAGGAFEPAGLIPPAPPFLPSVINDCVISRELVIWGPSRPADRSCRRIVRKGGGGGAECGQSILYFLFGFWFIHLTTI